MAAATARVGVATADLYPRFALGATLGRRSAGVTDLATGPSLFWAIGPTVRWPVFSGGRVRANIQVHEARLEQSRHRLESLTLTAIEEVENALVARDLDQQRARSLATAVAAAREALALATTRYTSGLESFLSVLDAERALYTLEAELTDSEAATLLDVIAVYKALGGG